MAAGASNAIGTGALILSANADKLVSGLDRAERVTNAKVDAINRKVADKAGPTIGAKIGGKIEGKFGEAFQGALFGSIAAMIAGVGKKVTESFIGMVNHSAKFRAEMEKSAALTAEWARVLDRAGALADERLGAVVAPAERLAAVGKDIDLATRELSGYRTIIEATRKEIEELNSAGSADSWKLWLGGGLADSIAEASERLKAAEGAAAKMGDRLAKLRDLRGRLLHPEDDPVLIGEVNKATAALEEQAATWGMTATEAQIYGLKAKGATDAMVAGIRAAGDTLETLDDLKGIERLADKLAAFDREINAAKVAGLADKFVALSAARDRAADPSRDKGLLGDIDKMNEALRFQAETWGMNAREADIYRLKVRGASDQMVAGLEQRAALLDKLDKMQKESEFLASHKTVGAFEKGSPGAYSVVAQFQAGNMLAGSLKQQDVAKRQLAEAQKANAMLGLIRDALAGAPKVGVI